MSKRIKFNDNHNKKGVEGWYELLPHDDPAPSIIIFYVEGSNSFWDWVFNFIPIRVKIKNRKAQYFYAKGGKWLAEFIQKVYLKHRVNTVILHGHSKGAAEAEIASYLLEDFNDLRIRVVTYGGARGLSTGLEGVKRYIHKGDLVPYVPFWPFFRSYKNKIYFGKLTWFWKAHDPDSYKEVMKKEGIQ